VYDAWPCGKSVQGNGAIQQATYDTICYKLSSPWSVCGSRPAPWTVKRDLPSWRWLRLTDSQAAGVVSVGRRMWTVVGTPASAYTRRVTTRYVLLSLLKSKSISDVVLGFGPSLSLKGQNFSFWSWPWPSPSSRTPTWTWSSVKYVQ